MLTNRQIQVGKDLWVYDPGVCCVACGKKRVYYDDSYWPCDFEGIPHLCVECGASFDLGTVNAGGSYLRELAAIIAFENEVTKP